jgi:hypothetical protein
MRFGLVACCLFAVLPSLAGFSTPMVAQNAADTDKPSKPVPTKEGALDAAHQVLGNYAVIVRYGELNRPGLTEAVAVVKRGPNSASAGQPITDLAVLQFRDGAWKVALSTDKYGAKNSLGYLGVAFLNDSISKASFHLKLLQRAEGKSRFTLLLTTDGRDGRTERAVPVAIAWNPAVERYEALNDHGAKFLPEVANPPTLKSDRSK